jgi:hypothetical protein
VTDTALSERIRQLEEALSRGDIDREDFLRTLTRLTQSASEDLTRRAGTPPPVPPAPSPATPPLPDALAHAPAGDSGAQAHDNTPPGPATLEPLFFDMPQTPDDWTPKPVDPGRVIVTGRSSWDKMARPGNLLGAERQGKEGEKRDDAAQLKRDYLARMASDSLRKTRRKKNAQAAFVMSLALGGLGHLYIGAIGVGSALLLVSTGCMAGLLLGEPEVLFLLAPMNLLAAALAHKAALILNRDIDNKTRAARRMRGTDERSGIDLDKSIRTTEQVHREVAD